MFVRVMKSYNPLVSIWGLSHQTMNARLQADNYSFVPKFKIKYPAKRCLRQIRPVKFQGLEECDVARHPFPFFMNYAITWTAPLSSTNLNDFE